MRSPPRHRRVWAAVRRRGLTLLELILSLALTAIILGAVSMAIDLHLRSFDTRRGQLEESQLARAILRMIADDLRGAVVYYEQDVSAVEKMLTESAASAVAGNATATAALGEEGASQLAESAAAMTEADETSAATSLTTATTLPARPGIYGNQYELQVDTSRLPRIDQYQAVLQPGQTTVVDVPSDVKTITYYVAATDSNTAASSLSELATASVNPQRPSGGLWRRELDRQVTQWAIDNGTSLLSDSAAELIAPEVLGAEFQYFDGVEWLLEWDSDANQGLPYAVSITLLVQPARSASSAANAAAIAPLATGSTTAAWPSDVHYYRLIVRIPNGQPVSEESTTTSDADLGL